MIFATDFANLSSARTGSQNYSIQSPSSLTNLNLQNSPLFPKVFSNSTDHLVGEFSEENGGSSLAVDGLEWW
jgi:hypothetical protein